MNMLFHNKKKIYPPPFQIDFHNHILPDVDDGSRSLEESIYLISSMSELGYRAIVFSPHISIHNHSTKKESILSLYQQITSQLKVKFPHIHFLLCGEYMMDIDFQKTYETSSLLSFGLKRYVLIEFPLYHYSEIFLRHLQNLIFSGYSPILAHPERYWYIESDDWFLELHHAGVMMQINFLSLIGYYGKDYQKKAEKIMQTLPSFYLCSDLHHSEQIPHIDYFFKNYTFSESIIHKIENQKLYEEITSELISP
ncbi:MAG: hypothetical protein N2Z72_01310 [Bacteroidales bacterium]|nr:hypothetical protein [Bacteroidales bacterium]